VDSLTARYLARELDALWRGRRVRACIFDAGRAAVVLSVDGGEAVEIDLSSPDVRVRFARLRDDDAASDRRSQLGGWSVGGVAAPLDDRRLIVELARPGRFKGSAERRAVLTVSAIPNARGAELRDAGGHRLAMLGARIPPRADPRPVPDEARLARAVRERDDRALLELRWVSGAVARWLLDDPERAAERYARILSDAPPEPAWCGAVLLPFPMCGDAVLAGSLIEPARETRQEAATGGGAARAAGSRATRLERARARMEAELERAREAPALRAIADAIAPLGDEPAPPEVTLANGSRAALEAKPGESARDAAERLYSTARSMERALELLPARIAKLEHDAQAAGAEPGPERERSRGPGAEKSTASLPYRRYRSSTGLEIRVGRGAAANDALTFRESSPNDVWLHARESAGAHVVLRWQKEETPPARALEEAAVLAALHSKSRGAALVPVDWTRRKYVRRARGGAPGSVIVQRSRTVMVRPDPALEKKLRET
jgi:hypothetical protein